jgi:DNA-binding transcriptional ArsR family regulator
VLRFLKALADQTRLRMLGLLASRERGVEELAAALGVRAPTVSHHLSLLKELELVEMRAEGTTHLYRLNTRGLGRMNKLLATPENLAVLAPESEGDPWERKVLRDFFDTSEAERLKSIPAQEKKRLVILRWLADRFEWDRDYTEAEVNEIIKRHHPDAAALRRYLIGAELMDRVANRYWRIHPLSAERLRALGDAFTWGALYSEAQVDELLRARMPSHAPATLRRKLLDSGLLGARHDTYWLAQPPLDETPAADRGPRA